MGDFFTPPAGFPFVPAEPDESAPKIEDLGASLGVGFFKSGALGGMLGNLFDILVRAAMTVLGAIINAALKLFAFFIRVLGGIDEEAAAGYGAVVAATIHNVFGVNVNPAAVGSRADKGGRAAAAQALGNALITALFGDVSKLTSADLKPSDARVKQFAGVVTQIELSGWLESWFADAVSYHLLEKYGDLKDGIVHAMGVSRMSRQAFAPLVKTLLHDPYLALLDNTFRPKPIAEGVALSAFLRNAQGFDDLSSILGPQGYSDAYIGELISQHQKKLPDEDVQYLLARGIWTFDQGVAYLVYQGWDNVHAATKLTVLADKAQQKYRDEVVTIATAAYERGDLDAGSLQSIINTSGLTDVEQSWLTSVANLRRNTHITHLSRGDIEQGILDGVMNFGDLSAWAVRNNMSQADNLNLELMILVKQGQKTAAAVAKSNAAKAKADAAKAKLDAAAAKALEVKAQAADKGVTIAQAEALVKSGDWTFDHLTAYLTAKQYGPEAITSIELLLHEAMGKAAATGTAATATRAAAKAKGLNLAEVERGVVEGILHPDDLTKYLTSQGFSSDDAAVILAETESIVNANQIKSAAKAAAAAKAGQKKISLPNLERAVKLGITPISTYTSALAAAGFDDADVALLTATLQAELAAAAAKAGTKTTAAKPATLKAPTFGQIEQEILAGVRPISDYTAALAAAGYSPADQTQLTALLQTRVDHSKHALALHADAKGKAAAKGIALASAEAAVLGGINQMADYDAMLTTLGYDLVDRQTLEALLQAKVAAKAAKAPAPAPAPAP